MNEKPLQRLNYYNGQRLEAADFKTEQDYHMRTRRWLNKSLYSAGIARGLDVRVITEGPKKDTPYVAVGPGLALDSDGREIILLEEEFVEVISFAGSIESTVEGNYLVVEYAEETIAYEKGGCAVRTTDKCASKSTTNWGGPSRIQAKVKFSWVPFVPQPGSNQIVLARVELAEGCKSVYQIDPGARRYIGAASAATVRQYALEGEREVAFIPKESFPTLPVPPPQPADVEIVGRIYFHIRGRQPNAVVLYLRALDFNPLHYTELGSHTHIGSLSGNINTTTLHTEHKHSASDLRGGLSAQTEPNTEHKHEVYARTGITGVDVTIGDHSGIGWVRTNGSYGKISQGGWADPATASPVEIEDPAGNISSQYVFMMEVKAGGHTHTVGGQTGYAQFDDESHTHSLNGISAQINSIGVNYRARGEEPLNFVTNMQIFVGTADNTTNRTTDIRQQLADADRANWADRAGNPKALGDGFSNHVLALSGTGPIRLDFLPGMAFAEGEYCIELRVDAKTETGKRVANGGKIHYNLYVE
jgi:hypothetical protein